MKTFDELSILFLCDDLRILTGKTHPQILLTKSMNVEIWVISRLNQLIIRVKFELNLKKSKAVSNKTLFL